MKIPVTRQLVDALQDLHIPDLVQRGMPKHTLYRIRRGKIDYLTEVSTNKLARSLNLSVEQLWRLATGLGQPEAKDDLHEEVEKRDCPRCRSLGNEVIELAYRCQNLPEHWRGQLEIRLRDIEYDCQVKKIFKAE